MDKRIRRNEICIDGQPRCDFVFSSTRSCFIAYGFKDSPLEMDILRSLLSERNIHPEEAGGSLSPGQSAFCAKICSKIITSQFCIVLLNNDEESGKEIPNANVNMEYGLILGFNKYVIPFQRRHQQLPFNVAGLDTVKYSNTDFKQLASKALDKAIEATGQDLTPKPPPVDQLVTIFLLAKKALYTPLNAEGDKALFQLGEPLGFNLLNDFGGFLYIFFGNFTAYRPEVVLWRLHLLAEILKGRASTLSLKLGLSIINSAQALLFKAIFEKTQIWILVTSPEDKQSILHELEKNPLENSTKIFCLKDVGDELIKLK